MPSKSSLITASKDATLCWPARPDESRAPYAAVGVGHVVVNPGVVVSRSRCVMHTKAGRRGESVKLRKLKFQAEKIHRN